MSANTQEAGFPPPGPSLELAQSFRVVPDSSSIGRSMSIVGIPEARNDTGLLEAALWWAGNGFRIHPLKPGSKQPQWTTWQDRATTDLNQVYAWWVGHKADNIGVATGNGIAVVDLDVKHGNDGTARFKEWLDEHFGAILPDPPAATRTPTGGVHLWYRAEGPVKTCTNWRPGVDVRGEGGYVVAPPSALRLSVDDGSHRRTEEVWLEYRTERASLLPMAPDALVAAINAEGGSSIRVIGAGGSAGHLDKATEFYRANGFRSGERDPSFQSLAWRLVRLHYPNLDLIRAIAYDVWTATDNTQDDPFPWCEVEKKITRAWDHLAPQIRAEYQWARRLGA